MMQCVSRPWAGTQRLDCQLRPSSLQCSINLFGKRQLEAPPLAGTCERRGARRACWQVSRRQRSVLVASSPESGVVNTTHLESLGKELDHPQGKLVIRLVQEADVKPATVVLTRAFATTGYLPLNDVGQYCRDMLKQPPLGVLLIARLYPQDASSLPEGQDSRLVGTVALSFSRDTREEFPTLQPPDNAAYLSNMAVCPGFRRQGVARHLLDACEELCAAREFRHIYLHVRLGDDPAQALYESSGYEHVDKDSFLVKLRGIMPRGLMRKAVPAHRVGGH